MRQSVISRMKHICMCVTAITHTFFCSKKAETNCNLFPLSTMYAISLCHSSFHLLIDSSYLFQQVTFQLIVRLSRMMTSYVPPFPSLSKDYLFVNEKVGTIILYIHYKNKRTI